MWIGLAAAIASIWILRSVLLAAARKNRDALASTCPGIVRRKKAPRLSVLVAARNEEEHIEACVRSLLEQDYPNLEVIAINDRSTDGTAAILGRLAREANGRLRVITVTDLPDGWFGKCNAMQLGIDAATGDYLCFTDADCQQLSSESLSIAMRRVLDEKVDFLTLTPVLEVRSAWDSLVQPACAWVFMIWFRPQLVNNPARTTAYANGAFMLMSRRCCDALGGFEQVRGQLGEDVELGRMAKRQGFHLKMLENVDLYQTRMYSSFEESWRGWTRIFHASLRSAPKLLTSITSLAVCSVLPAIMLLVAVVGRLQAGTEAVTWWNNSLVAWGTVVGLMQLNALWFYRILGVRALWSLTYAGGALVTIAMLADALFQQLGFRRTVWRGIGYRNTGRSEYRQAA